MGLETVEILVDIEDHFHVSLPDDEASACITVADLQKLVIRELSQGQSENAELHQVVWNGILTVLVKNGYSVEKIRPESKWVGDITIHG